MSIKKEVISYKNFGDVLSISNGIVDLCVTIDIGPRILRYGFVGGTNIMYNDTERIHANSGEEYDNYYYKGATWYNYGGHRLWISPESSPETCYPDNDPVDYVITEFGAVFNPRPQTENGVAHQIEIKMSEDSSDVQVIHRVKNISDKPISFALWALSVFKQGGTEIIPLETKDTGLLPNRWLSLWPYTDIHDNRLYIGNEYATLGYDPSKTNPIKIGTNNTSGTGFYVFNDIVFINKYKTNHTNGNYPDGGMSFESYANADFLELESLSEYKTVNPNSTEEHTENWSLTKNPGGLEREDEESIAKFLKNL